MRFIVPQSRRRAAMTLVELMVAMGVSSLLIVVLLMLSVYTARSFAAISNYVTLDKESRKALDQLSLMIRESDGVTGYSTNQLRLSYHGEELLYQFSKDRRVLTQTWHGVSKTLLEGCDNFTFSIFQRNPVEGTYDQYPATLEDSAAKIVQVSWICSRQLLGKLINTESIQSAKIVIRKE